MKTKDIESVIFGSGYAGGGVVEFHVGDKWYKVKPEELLKILHSADVDLVAKLARVHEYVTVKEEK